MIIYKRFNLYEVVFKLLLDKLDIIIIIIGYYYKIWNILRDIIIIIKDDLFNNID